MKRRLGVAVIVPTALALTANAGQPAGAERNSNAAPSIAALAEPVEGQVHEGFLPEGPGDRAIAGPDHPDFDLVPPMPMPETNILRAGFDVESTDTLTFHNAETGETFEMPVSADLGRALSDIEGNGGITGGSSFVGADERVDSEFSQGGEGLGTMSVISDANRASFPWRANVKLLMEFDNGSGGFDYFVCSGSMQDPGVVLTAAHCVYNRDYPGFATRVWVYPGWTGDGGLGASYTTFDNFGYAVSRSYIAGTGWINSGDRDRDVAAIRIDRNDGADGGRNIGALTGWFGWAYGGGCGFIQDRTYHNASYPSEGCGQPGLHNGGDMTYWFGSVDDCPDNQMQINTTAGCYTALWGGQSGSAMYYIDGSNRFAHAVASTSNRTTRGFYAKLWEQFTTDMESFKTTQRGSSLDIEPLQVRANGSTSARAGESFSSSFIAQLVNATNNNPGSQTYTVRVYLSSNNNISTADRLLATWNYTLDIAANSVNPISIPAPAIPLDVNPGDYHIGIIVDAPGDVRSINDDTDSWDAQPVTVLTANAPSQPGLVSPPNFSTGRSLGQDIDWSASSNATGYDVYFGTDSTPDSGELVASNISGTFYNAPVLDYATTYYWRIVARGPGGNTSSPTWRFTTQDAPFFDLSANTVLWQNKSTYTQGEPIEIFHNVSNVGTATSISFNIDMRLSTNTTISTADWGLGARGILGLSAGQSNSGTNTYTVPLDIPNGTYHLGMFFNPTPNGDANSANNSVVDSVQVTINKCPADIAAPWGNLDLVDIDTFVNGFTANDAVADIAPPFGNIDLVDIDLFINTFLNGCP